jgi:hypothetical protein
MIRKSGSRFFDKIMLNRDKIMLNRNVRAPIDLI